VLEGLWAAVPGQMRLSRFAPDTVPPVPTVPVWFPGLVSNVTVTATDGTGASGNTSFTWTVNPSGGGGGIVNGGFETGDLTGWTPAANGELVSARSGKCLDDPAFSTTDGTQLEIWTCNGGINQQWTLP
jgi:hypothetical protein